MLSDIEAQTLSWLLAVDISDEKLRSGLGGGNGKGRRNSALAPAFGRAQNWWKTKLRSTPILDPGLPADHAPIGCHSRRRVSGASQPSDAPPGVRPQGRHECRRIRLLFGSGAHRIRRGPNHPPTSGTSFTNDTSVSTLTLNS
jgi:hypothetical protein